MLKSTYFVLYEFLKETCRVSRIDILNDYVSPIDRVRLTLWNDRQYRRIFGNPEMQDSITLRGEI